MQQIGIYIKSESPESIALAKKAIDTIRAKDFEPVFLSRQLDNIIFPDVKRLDIDHFFKDSECIIVFGGDGTLLSVGRRAAPYQTPLFGINAGRLGFLTEGEADHSEDLIETLLSGDVTEDNRMMLECKLFLSGGREDKFLALNDIVIKNEELKLTMFRVVVDDLLLENYRADGLIIATPTGSTAYSLAANGPIVHPSTKAIIINPICPQNLNSRPVILPDNATIRIYFDSTSNDLLLSIDGQDNIKLNSHDYLEIQVSEYTTNLLRLKDSSYFERIRSKLL